MSREKSDEIDPKDAQVILHLLKVGTTQVYYDPLENHYNDLQELANTYQQILRCPIFCTTGSATVYITARGCEV